MDVQTIPKDVVKVLWMIEDAEFESLPRFDSARYCLLRLAEYHERKLVSRSSMSQSELERTYIQDGLHGNHCYGCGAWNDKGLQIKSYWDGDVSVCVFQPEPHHAAMPPDVMNGGTIASIIDCHCVCSAMADAYRTEGLRWVRAIRFGTPQLRSQ